MGPRLRCSNFTTLDKQMQVQKTPKGYMTTMPLFYEQHTSLMPEWHGMLVPALQRPKQLPSCSMKSISWSCLTRMTKTLKLCITVTWNAWSFASKIVKRFPPERWKDRRQSTSALCRRGVLRFSLAWNNMLTLQKQTCQATSPQASTSTKIAAPRKGYARYYVWHSKPHIAID